MPPYGPTCLKMKSNSNKWTNVEANVEAAELGTPWRKAPGGIQERPPLSLHSCLIQLLGHWRPLPGVLGAPA